MLEVHPNAVRGLHLPASKASSKTGNTIRDGVDNVEGGYKSNVVTDYYRSMVELSVVLWS